MKKVKIHIVEFWKWVFIVISTIFVVFVGVRITEAVKYRNAVQIHVLNAQRAANATIAQSELKVAINNLQEMKLTEGQAIGLIEREDSIGFYYKNLNAFLGEMEKFDENTDPEVYQVELNSVQARLESNEAPYFISLRNKTFAVIYVLSYILIFASLCIFLFVDGEYSYTETYYEIPVPNFSRKEATS